MNCWRITKDSDEWTCFSEVGTKLEYEEYIITEEKYLEAIKTFWDETGVNQIYITALEQWSDGVESQNARKYLSNIWIGKAIKIDELLQLAQHTLRNVCWCKVEIKNRFLYILVMTIICISGRIEIVRRRSQKRSNQV